LLGSEPSELLQHNEPSEEAEVVGESQQPEYDKPLKEDIPAGDFQSGVSEDYAQKAPVPRSSLPSTQNPVRADVLPMVGIHFIGTYTDPPESEGNDTNLELCKKNAPALHHLVVSDTAPSPSSLAIPTHQLSLAAASPFNLTFSHHQSPKTSESHSPQREQSSSPLSQTQKSISSSKNIDGFVSDSRYLNIERTDLKELASRKRATIYSSKRVSKYLESPQHHQCLTTSQQLEKGLDSSEMIMNVEMRLENSSKALLRMSLDSIDISTQSHNTTPTLSGRNIPPSSVAKNEVQKVLSEHMTNDHKIGMEEIQEALTQQFSSQSSQGKSLHLSQGFADASITVEQLDVSVMTAANDRAMHHTAGEQVEVLNHKDAESNPKAAARVEERTQPHRDQPSFNSSPPSVQSLSVVLDVQRPLVPAVESGTLRMNLKPGIIPALTHSPLHSEPQRRTDAVLGYASSSFSPGVGSLLALAEPQDESSSQTGHRATSYAPQSSFAAAVSHESNIQTDSKFNSPHTTPQSPWTGHTESHSETLPRLDWNPSVRPHTPEYAGIRPFSDFMSPSPSPDHNNTLFKDGPLNTPVLIEAATKNPWKSNLKKPRSRGSGKRVSFGILPKEDTSSQKPESQRRISSPPPQASHSAEYEDVSLLPKKLSKLFTTSKRVSTSVGKTHNSLYSSPGFGAQAEAFIAADLEPSVHNENNSPTRHLKQRNLSMDNVPRAIELFDEYGFDRARYKSPDLATFDMDDVLGDVGDFLEDWSVDAELKKARDSENGKSSMGEKTGSRSGSAVRRDRLFESL
jgi:hypothetical protein